MGIARDMGGDGLGMGREFGPVQEDARPGTLGQPRDLGGRLAKVRGHPDDTDPPAGEHRFEELVAVRRLDKQPVALLQPVLRPQRLGKGRRAGRDLGPRPDAIAPDEARGGRPAAGLFGQEMGEVHHPGRDRRHPRRGACGHGRRSSTEQ
jgi:hypothetical protein